MDMQDAAPPEAPAAAPDPVALLARADALRDGRDWAEAAQAYAGYLQLRAEDWPIWVQYGHCMKEAGDPRAALLLYREAERLKPDDADLHLQLGHALKLLGRVEDALEEYARALTLDPGNAAARDELLAADTVAEAPATPIAAEPLSAGPLSAEPVLAEPRPDPVPALAAPEPAAGAALASAAAVVFDASDLLDYFRHNRAPTGIQRVQLNLIREALATPAAQAAGFDPRRGTWVALPAALFRHLAGLSRSGADIADPAWAAAMAEVQALLRDAPPLAFAPGSTLVNLGTSWWIPDYLRRVREAKARHGLRYVPFIHDCIPLIVPEHCSAGLVEEFARWFASVALHADAVLTNSACTQADFHAQLHRLLPGLDLPSFVVPLDAADPVAPAEPPPAQPYVLCVGTIESRKNHLLVFNAWLSLVRKHGAEAVPDLVCVGKKGWLAEAALALHANSPTLRAKVRLLHKVPDLELEALYRGCLFTVYNSFYEGWGLPVTESLAHGKVAVVPDHSSLREAGGAGAIYFAPQSEPDLVAKLEPLILDPEARQAAEARLAGVRLRPWPALAAQVLGHLAALENAAPLPPPLGRLGFRLGEIHELRLLPGGEPSIAMALADALREGPGWERLEAWGAWTTPAGPARLRLPLPEGPGEARLRVMLELRGPPEPCRATIRAFAAGAAPGPFQPLELAAGERAFASLAVRPGAARELVVEFAAQPGIALPAAGGLPQRQVGVGVGSLMACREDDLLARLDYLERKALPLRAL